MIDTLGHQTCLTADCSIPSYCPRLIEVLGLLGIYVNYRLKQLWYTARFSWVVWVFFMSPGVNAFPCCTRQLGVVPSVFTEALQILAGHRGPSSVGTAAQLSRACHAESVMSVVCFEVPKEDKTAKRRASSSQLKHECVWTVLSLPPKKFTGFRCCLLSEPCGSRQLCAQFL